jgi:hypothetical protein
VPDDTRPPGDPAAGARPWWVERPPRVPPDAHLWYVEFESRREGMIFAMEGGLWLHHHVWKGRAMAHLVSVNRERLLAYGEAAFLPADRLQYKPLKDPRDGIRRDAWHWDLLGPALPPRGGR